MSSLTREIQSLLSRKFIYCDVGARFGIDEPWKSFREVIDLLCFEPDDEEYDQLQRARYRDDKIFNCALYKEKANINLNLTKSRGCSSIYRPNFAFLKSFAEVERFKIEKSVMVNATSIDLLSTEKLITNLDFIKIDVQGAEVDILMGGRKFLAENALGIEVEVEFHQLYENQPLFADVDKCIREYFELQIQDLRKSYWKYPEGINTGTTKGQLVFGDALYFRSPHQLLAWCSNLPAEEAKDKILMACLMGIIYGYPDYSLCILEQHKVRDFLEEQVLEKWKALILAYGKSFNLQGVKGVGVGTVARAFDLLFRMCQPTHNGWASIGQHLGSRKKMGVFT